MCTRPHTPLPIHPLMRKQSNLQVSQLVMNFLLSYEAFMVQKDFRISLQNNCQPSSKQGFALVYIEDITFIKL